MTPTRPLPPGTLIEYCDMRAKVIEDNGGDRLIVEADGEQMWWYWHFCGTTCTVVESAPVPLT